MKIDFKKILADNGLKVGDKVRFKNGDICELQQTENNLILKILGHEDSCYFLSALGFYDFEKVEPKKTKQKVGDVICNFGNCKKCPLHSISCVDYEDNTLRERFEATLKAYPELEPMREYFEAELEKEIEE